MSESVVSFLMRLRYPIMLDKIIELASKNNLNEEAIGYLEEFPYDQYNSINEVMYLLAEVSLNEHRKKQN